MDSTKTIAELGASHWYHQRFDGSPMYLSLIGEADTRPEERIPKGVEARWLTCFYESGKADGYLDLADINRGAAILTNLAEKDINFSSDLLQKWQNDEEAFDAYYEQFDRAFLKTLSDEGLAEEFEHFRKLAVKRLTSTCIIDHFALGTDQTISDLLKSETKVTNESELNKIFSTATAPIHNSFINKAELELLRIAERVQKGADIHSPPINDLLQQHQEHWFWIRNNYVSSTILSVADFEEEIVAWLSTGKDLQQYADALQQKAEDNYREKEILFTQFHFSNQLRGMLKMSEDLTHWQDERKRATYLAIYLGSCMLQEMGSRRGINADLLKYLVPAEVSDWFLKNTVQVRQLEEREKGSFVVWECDKTTVFSGPIVAEIRAAMDNQETNLTTDIRGLVACTGKAQGVARIVTSVDEIGKVKEGDILIAVMTRPDYVPAMRKAAAIVTNEGGITCHAAIVSRELGIPCIIGTRIATKVFEDGDLVEVNANHNWVRKVTEA